MLFFFFYKLSKNNFCRWSCAKIKTLHLTQTPMPWPLRPPLASLQSVFRWVCQTHIMREEAGTATQEPSAELKAQCLSRWYKRYIDRQIHYWSLWEEPLREINSLIVWMWTSVERGGFSRLGKRANTHATGCSWRRYSDSKWDTKVGLRVYDFYFDEHDSNVSSVWRKWWWTLAVHCFQSEPELEVQFFFF